MIKTNGKVTTGLKGNYAELLCAYAPRPIKNDDQFWAVQNIVDQLLDQRTLTADQRDFLLLLGMLIEQYESQNNVLPDLRGVELIKALIDDLGLRQKDLVPIFKTESIVSAVLNNHRQLTVEHIKKLSTFFNLPAELFFTPRKGEAESARLNHAEKELIYG